MFKVKAELAKLEVIGGGRWGLEGLKPPPPPNVQKVGAEPPQ